MLLDSYETGGPEKELCESRGSRPWLPSLLSLIVCVDEKYHERRSCIKVEVAVLGSPSIIVFMVSAEVKHHERRRSCVKVELAVVGPPSLIVRTVSVDVKLH